MTPIDSAIDHPNDDRVISRGQIPSLRCVDIRIDSSTTLTSVMQCPLFTVPRIVRCRGKRPGRFSGIPERLLRGRRQAFDRVQEIIGLCVLDTDLSIVPFNDLIDLPTLRERQDFCVDEW